MISPAKVFSRALTAEGVCTHPTDDGNWPVFISRLPKTPIEAIAVYDTPPSLDGRLAATGEVIEHPGLQVRVRAKDYETGYNKIDAIKDAIDGFKETEVTYNSVDYTIKTVKRSTGILPLGENPENGALEFTVNATATISNST